MYGQLQTDYYVARGGGRESWMPRFSYKGFQYVQLSGPNHTPLPAGVSVSLASVRQVRSSVASTGELDVSQPTLARIHRNTQWAVQSNLHGVITDTPVYEKNGWTGDAQLMAPTASLLFDTQRLYRKMFQDMADAQTADGEVPLLSPSNRNYGYVGKPAFKPVDCCGATPAWDAFWFVLPWESYQRYGDIRALERTYPLMKKYLDDWIPRWTAKDGDGYAYTLTSGLGDWLPPKGVPTINALVSTAFLARMAEIAAGTARALHDAPGAAKYDQLFDHVRSDFNARFLSADGVYREKAEDGFVQTAQILPLAFHLVPDAQRAAVAERLADDITNRRGGHAYVGVIGAAYVLPVLTATGHHDVAFTVATRTDEPSWGYWTDTLKFTALGESWPADTRSRNHHFFGAIVQWFYEDLAGLRPLEPGFALIGFTPHVPTEGLDHVAARYDSGRGPIRSEWTKSADGIHFRVTVPPTSRGRIDLPASDPMLVRVLHGAGDGNVALADAPGVSVETERGRPRPAGIRIGRVPSSSCAAGPEEKKSAEADGRGAFAQRYGNAGVAPVRCAVMCGRSAFDAFRVGLHLDAPGLARRAHDQERTPVEELSRSSHVRLEAGGVGIADGGNRRGSRQRETHLRIRRGLQSPVGVDGLHDNVRQVLTVGSNRRTIGREFQPRCRAGRRQDALRDDAIAVQADSLQRAGGVGYGEQCAELLRLAGRLLGDHLVVQEQPHPLGARVDLHLEVLPFMTRPRPTRQRGRDSPEGGHDGLPVRRGQAHRRVDAIASIPEDVAVIRLRLALSDEVDVAAGRLVIRPPREQCAHHRALRGVL